MDDFVNLVSRLNGQSQKTEPDAESQGADDATNALVDMPLARKAWEWLTIRPEILVGRDGSRGKLSLDDALALPAPLAVVVGDENDAQTVEHSVSAPELGAEGTVDAGKGVSKNVTKKGKKKAASTSAVNKQEKQLSRRGAETGAKNAATAGSARGTDTEQRPRLHVTERTLWYTLTGHDVDYKKVPLLEWKCLQGIASVRRKGILQADLRILVDQDKRSVPKRTDFLAAKGYIVKRTTIARGYRTSMMWLTEFAPIELPDGDVSTISAAKAKSSKPNSSEVADSSLLSPTDLASSGIDFSPEFLKKNLEPVPWRDRWLGETIDFASFGQTVLAIVKAWGVMRLVDLKIKLGILSKRWQMRTLARVCREFTASGVLRFVAAIHPDERKMFKDCIKFERDPTPNEWTIYLAAGRRRMPLTDMRAKMKKEQDQQRSRNMSLGIGTVDGDDASLLDPSLDQSLLDLAALEEEEEYEFGESGVGGAFGSGGLVGAKAAGSASTPAWASDIPLVNLIFDTIDRSGIDGITSPEICRATLGTAFSRYIFTLVTAMARPGTQPAHLQKFQLHCESTRVGKNHAYLFRTLENAKLAERLSNGESLDEIEQQTVSASTTRHADAARFWDLNQRGVLQDLPADELRRLYGFEPFPEEPTAEEVEQQREARRAVVDYPRPMGRGRPKKNYWASDAIDHTSRNAEVAVPVQDDEVDDKMQDEDDEADTNMQGIEVDAGLPEAADSADALAPDPSPPRRKRGRPRKARSIVEHIEVDLVEEEAVATSPNIAPIPLVRFGEPGSLNPSSKSTGRPSRSAVLIIHHDHLRNPNFLSNQEGYRNGPPRLDSDEEQEKVGETVFEQTEDSRPEAEMQAEAECPISEPSAADLQPVAVHYNGSFGHLTYDLTNRTLLFTNASTRRGRSAAKPKEPITIPVDNLDSDPLIRKAPGGDGEALVLEMRESKIGGPTKDTELVDDDDSEREVQQMTDRTIRSVVFILDKCRGDEKSHAAALCESLVASRLQPAGDKQDSDDDNPQPLPLRRRGRRPGKKKKGMGQTSTKKTDVGSEQYVCETCSGVWKNIHGLQYHQTKSRAACNPDYVDKRKRQWDGVEQPVQGVEASTEPPPSLAQTRGRRELRPRKPPVAPVRNGSSESVTSSRSNSPAPSGSEVESCTSPESPLRRNNYQRLEVHSSRRTPAYQLAVFEDSDSDNDKNGPRGISGAMRAALISRKEPLPTSLQSLPLAGGPLDCRDSSSPKLEAAPATKRYEVTGATDESREGDSVSTTLQKVEHAPTNGHNAYFQPLTSTPAAAVHPESRPSPRRVSLGRNLDVNQNTASSPIFADSAPTTSPGRGDAGFWMPRLPKNTINKLSPFAVRSLIVMEITKYLVDYFGGVFPSDRSLWYAAFRIYMRSYPGEDPPTLTATKAAIKKLEVGKEVEEHTFGFRDPRGQFIYCRLLVRPGIDVYQSETAAEFKRQVQATYPQPYVPDEFMPSEKDMAILRILDKDIDKGTARGARGRRPLAPEIEVLHAPFYERQPVVRPVPKTVVLYGNDEDGSNEAEDSEAAEQAQQGEQRRPSNLKRKDVASGAKGQGAPKRRRTRFAVAIASHESIGDNEDIDNDSGSAGVGTAGNDYADLSVASDNEADIDPALRTVKQTKSAPRTYNTLNTPIPPETLKTPKMHKARKPAATGNPGLESLPASFFATSTAHLSQSRSKRPIQLRDEADDDFATFIHFLPPNKHLEDGQEALQQQLTEFSGAGEELARTAAERATPRQIKFVTKTHQLHDMGKKSARAWPIITETTFERQSDASFTMDGFMPTRKALLRENLPRTPLECAAMLRGNQKISIVDDTPESQVLRDLEYCRSWELSQMGTDILNQPSVAPHYVFLNVSFPGEHYTAEMGEVKATGLPVGKAEASSPMCWLAKNQYTVETIPYGSLDTDEPGSAVDSLAASAPVQRRKVLSSSAGGADTDTTSDLVAMREKQTQQAKYLAQSRREMTAYPQAPEDFIRLETEAHSDTRRNQGGGAVDWSSNDTLLATFIVIKTLLGGLNQTIDWGLMMRLFPNKQVSTLRLFWTNTRRERQQHIDELTERFQEAFLAAYDRRELPPLDFDNVLAYDWPWMISWALPHLTLRQEGAINKLPATREALWGENGDKILAEMPPVRTAAWREEFFQVSRSVWNRLQDSASEAAALALDQPLPITPAEIVAVGKGGSADQLRNIVARSWIRALCGTPYQRYPPSQIKQKLLTLGSIGAMEATGGNGSVAAPGNTLGETDTNSLLQTVISNLTNDRILRRAKSMMSLGGRMYMLTELYESTMEKMASVAKFLRAYKFKEMLDAVFRGGVIDSYEIPVESNDDGMVVALLNMQAHGRIMLEAVDAPHIPFGFEPGNYESRKFPKQYQRFRMRIKPTAMYMYNEHEYLKQTFDRIARAWLKSGPSEVAGLGDAEIDDAPPKQGPNQEMPIWRDFFGVLDKGWFARLTGAVVFSLATRGASPVRQTTLHLRPIVEPFEVQMITDWATRLGFLAGGGDCDHDLNQFPPGSRMVTEWWWLLMGHMYLSVKGEVVQEVASTG